MIVSYGERLSIRVYLVLKSYYGNYESFMFHEEFDRVKFFISDQVYFWGEGLRAVEDVLKPPW